MTFPHRLTTFLLFLINGLYSTQAALGPVSNLYALPNAAFIQNEAGDEQVILEDFSESLSTLQAAINTARSDYPEAFILIRLKPGGVYTVSSSPLVLGSKMCLTGNATRIDAAGAGVTTSCLLRITPGSSYVSMSNVILDGKLAAVRGIEATGVARVNIDNIIVTNTGLAGIFLQGPGIEAPDSQITVANCNVSGTPGNAGIHLKNATQAVCIENTSSTNREGLLLTGVSRSTVVNNRCSENSGTGILLTGNSTATNVINNLVSGNSIGISLDATTVRNTLASNEIRSASTGIALNGIAHTLYDNVFPSGVTTPVQTASTNHHIITTSTGFATIGQNYFYPPTILNDHSAQILVGKANTNLTTAATTISQIQAAYDAARAANPDTTLVLRLTAPVISGDATLTLTSNTCVVICGRVNLAPGITGFASTNSTFVSISGGVIDGGNTTGRRGMEFAGCYRVLVDRVTLQNFGDKNTRANGSDLIWFSKGGSPCIVAHCTLNGGSARGIWTVDATARFLFTDNTISNVNMDGIDLDAYTNSALVKFNSVSGCVRNGIFVEEGAKHNQVIGNTVASNPIAINLYAYYISLTSYNSIIANTCTSNGRGIRVGARSTMSTEHNFIFGNKITQTGPQSALDAQVFGEENYFSQNALLNNADDIGSTSAVFFNSPAMRTASVPVVAPEQLTALNGTFFQYQILATQFPYLFTRVGGSIPTGLSLNTASGVLSGTPFIAGTYNISVTATNLQGVSSPKIIQVLVQTLPSTPKPILADTASASGKVGTAFAYSITAANAPTYFLVTSLPAGLTANTTTGLISGSPLLDGTFATKIYAANAGGTSNQTLSILIAPTIPQITSANSAKAQVGQSFTYRITAANLPRTYGAASLPPGLTLNATSGLISGTPTTTGNASVTLSASNAGGTGTKSLALIVTPPAPVITSATTSNATLGTAFSYQITATHSPTHYAASSLPVGLTVNASSGLISGIPLDDGTFTAKIYASNLGGMGNRTLTIAIAAKIPQITSATLAKPQAGMPFSYRISALNLPRTFGATSLPAGLTLNGTSGVISGTPTTPGNRTATISASNTAGTDTKTLTFSILPAVPVITSAGTSNATFGTAYSYQITATNTPTRFSATSLPAGLTINATSGLLSGIPLGEGIFATKVYAMNAGGTGSRTLTIAIASKMPEITSAATATARAGTLFSYRITAANLPKTFGAASLPGGLTVNATSGYITGIPTTAGNTTVNITASNTAGTATKSVALVVLPAAPAITSASTSHGKTGLPYSHQVAATPAPTRYTATDLPPGLTLNTTTGLISGIPALIGTFTLKISAIHANGTGSQIHTLYISTP